jgi:hypothetical protein
MCAVFRKLIFHLSEVKADRFIDASAGRRKIAKAGRSFHPVKQRKLFILPRCEFFGTIGQFRSAWIKRSSQKTIELGCSCLEDVIGLRETAAVAIRHGVKLQDSGFTSEAFLNASEAEAIKAVQADGEKRRTSAPGFRQSILQDADRNRRLEVNETLDYTLALAKDFGVAVPTLDLCCRVLRVVSRAAG